MRSWSLPLALAAVLPGGGCCSMARFFCGPDRTPWVSVDYTTPELAARTLLEAVRRNEPEIVYRSLSPGYRQDLGLDQATMVLAWQKVLEANPGLHVAGYAEVPGAVASGPDRARIEFAIEGTPVAFDLVRQRSWQVRYRRSNGTPAEPGERLPSFAGHAAVTESDDGSKATLQIAPLTFPIGIEPVAVDALESAGLTSEWKVARIRQLGDG